MQKLTNNERTLTGQKNDNEDESENLQSVYYVPAMFWIYEFNTPNNPMKHVK